MSGQSSEGRSEYVTVITRVNDKTLTLVGVAAVEPPPVDNT